MGVEFGVRRVDIAEIPVTIAFGLVGTDEGAAFVVQDEGVFHIKRIRVFADKGCVHDLKVPRSRSARVEMETFEIKVHARSIQIDIDRPFVCAHLRNQRSVRGEERASGIF